MVNFSARVTLKFNDLKKTILRLVYTTLSFLHHIKANGEFRLELQAGNTQLGSKSVIFV